MQLIEIQKGVRVGIEDLVQGAAQMETADLEKLADQLNYILARRKTPHPSEQEMALIARIYEALKLKGQDRFEALQAKLADELITDEEYQELMTMTKITEEQNVIWLDAVVELAQLRNVSPTHIIHQLGLHKRSTRLHS